MLVLATRPLSVFRYERWPHSLYKGRSIIFNMLVSYESRRPVIYFLQCLLCLKKAEHAWQAGSR